MMSIKPLSISVLDVQGVAVAELSGTCYEGGDAVEAAFEPVTRVAALHGWRLAVGMSGISFLNSRGISMLLQLRNSCHKNRGCFVMYELFEAAEHALVTLKLMPILKIAGSRGEAVRQCLEHGGSNGPPGPPSSGSPGAAFSRPPRLAVMISGAGRTLFNLADRAASNRLRASIALVVASRECAGATVARSRGMNVRVTAGRIPRDQLASLLHEHDIDFVVLAGYLHFVEVPSAYQGRVVNIHPSLLPEFGGKGMYGHHVHEAVLKSGAKESGCTVHLVDDRYDSGPVLLQRRCKVEPSDTPDQLAARVFDLELDAYPDALNALFARAAAARGANMHP